MAARLPTPDLSKLTAATVEEVADRLKVNRAGNRSVDSPELQRCRPA
jgi:hypothetical protein